MYFELAPETKMYLKFWLKNYRLQIAVIFHKLYIWTIKELNIIRYCSNLVEHKSSTFRLSKFYKKNCQTLPKYPNSGEDEDNISVTSTAIRKNIHSLS